MIKNLILLKIQNVIDIQEVLPQWFINFLTRKTSANCANKFAGSGIKNENISNKELAEELHKSIIKKSKNEKYTQLL